MTIFVLTILLFIQSTAALIGYDCGSRYLNVTTLSLRDVGDCDIPDDAVNVTSRYIQLLQLNEYTEASVYQCKLEIHRTVYYCGMHSHVSVVSGGENEYIFGISKRDCLQLHKVGLIQITNTQTIMGVKVNTSSTHSITFAGFINNEGKCKGVGYSDPYGSWDDVVVQGTVKVTIAEQTAQIKLSHNKIHLKSGTTCTLSEGSCVDIDGGYTFWDPIPTDTCKFYQYGVLYEGLANKMIDLSHNSNQVVYSIATKDITFALTATGKDMVCGYTITKTEHPKLLIFETERGNSFAPKGTESISNLDIFAYVNSKFIYVEKHIRAQMKSLYKDVVLQRCNIERQTIKTSLSLATQAPDEFAFDIMKGPGYMAVVAGEVVHVIKCIPVEVKIRLDLELCYAELKVHRNNDTYFLTPRTHILKSKGTQIPCNKLLPPYYYINHAWYKIMPIPTEAKIPHIIQPSKGTTWEYINPSELATSGIYTETDLEQLRERIMFPVERPAILNDLAREMRGHPIEDNEGVLSKLLNDNVVEKLINNTWVTIWNRFMTFGTVSAGFIALLMIIHVVKLVIDIAIQGYALHSIYGWSIHLLGAVWSSITHLLIHLGTTKESDKSKDQVQEAASSIPLVEVEQTEEKGAKKESSKSTERVRKPASDKTFFSLSG